MRLHNHVAAEKEPVGDFLIKKSFVGFEGFMIKRR